MCAPSPPPPPDYAAAAREQGAANVDAARVSGKLNNPNVVNPYGNQTVTFGAAPQFDSTAFNQALSDYQNSGKFKDLTGAENSGSGPRRDQFTVNSADTDHPTITQTFSPEQQALYEQSNKVKGLLGGLGEQGATALQGVVGKQFDLSGVPNVGNYDATRQKVIDAMMSRADEDYSKTTDQSNSDLIAAGIRPGTKAYADRMQMVERSRNDARQNAEIAGGNAAQQAYSMDSQRRKDAIAELLAQRQTPLNEVSALMSGSQVSNPFAVPGYSQGANVAPPPIFNAAMQQYGAQSDIYNANAAQSGQTTSGLMGLGAAAIMAF